MSKSIPQASPNHKHFELRAADGVRGQNDHDLCSSLPAGVKLRALSMHRDARGGLAELFRDEWEPGISVLQWNFAESKARVLRGMHAHFKHWDYLVIMGGHASIGLKDLREGSSTEGLSAMVEMRGENLSALLIPPGVAHGFYFHEPSLHVYAVSEYWEPADELGCHWADDGLGLSWPDPSPLISERDAALPPLSELKRLPLWRSF